MSVPAGQSAEAVLSAQGLTKRYGARTVLSAVDVELRGGQLAAIIGPNGAGKTTLLSILAGVTRPDSGAIESHTDGIGWVPQHPAVYSKLTVAENLELFARLEGVQDIDGATEGLLHQIELTERRDEQVGRLSGGNRQRVNIAVGLLSRPAVLLLDEPTASLDPPQRARLWQFLAELAAMGTSILYSTHNLREVERHAERVLLLDEGVLRFSGTIAELAEAAEQAARDPSAPAFLQSLAEIG